jgi:copper chaperone CopZ
MAGPAVNMASILVLNKAMGRKALLIYLSSIILGAVSFGLTIDYLLPREWFTNPLVQVTECCNDSTYYFNLACTIFLSLLFINALIRRFIRKPQYSCNGECNDKSQRTTIIHIEGMRCNHCRTNTEKALASLPEVDHAEVDLASGQATITGNVDLTLIKQTVESLGFKVKNLQ